MIIERNKKPPVKGGINFRLPNIEKFVLNNGLEVLFVKKDKLPIIKLSLIIDAGSYRDRKGKEGLSYLTALLVDEGAGPFNALELDNEIETLGSSIDLSVDPDTTLISLQSLTENFEKTLELFSYIVKEPHFDEVNFEREKKKHLTKILQSFDDPSYIAENAFQKVIFKNSCYEAPILGYTESVNSLQNDMVKQFYQEFYSSNNSKLVVVGNIELEALRDLLNNCFEDWVLKTKISFDKKKFNTESARVYFIDKEGSAQSEITAGNLTKQRYAADFLAARIGNTILGGQFSSRINLNLREDKGYTYGAQSALNYTKLSGYFTVQTSVQREFTVQAINEIHKEIEGVNTGITQAEVDFAKSYLIKRFPSIFETYSQIVQNLISKVEFELPDDYFNTYIDNLSGVNKKQIEKAAQEYFLSDNIQYFIVGDKKTIWNDLAKIKDLEVIELDRYGNMI